MTTTIVQMTSGAVSHIVRYRTKFAGQLSFHPIWIVFCKIGVVPQNITAKHLAETEELTTLYLVISS